MFLCCFCNNCVKLSSKAIIPCELISEWYISSIPANRHTDSDGNAFGAGNVLLDGNDFSLFTFICNWLFPSGSVVISYIKVVQQLTL